MTEQIFPGKLIALEGIDGAGKSSVGARVVALLQEDGCDVLLTREPGGTEVGKKLRSLVADGSCHAVPRAEYFLFTADRALHMHELIRPALKQGKVVVSDRMGDSSIAYQGYGRGVSLDLIQYVNQEIMSGCKPDLTVYLAIDYATAYQRIALRKGEQMPYDREKALFFKKVVEGYEALYANRSDVLRIDARLTIETCAQLVYQRICCLLGDARE